MVSRQADKFIELPSPHPSPQRGETRAAEHVCRSVAERFAGVEHHDRLAAGFQQAMHFVDGALRVRRVMQHPVAVDDVE